MNGLKSPVGKYNRSANNLNEIKIEININRDTGTDIDIDTDNKQQKRKQVQVENNTTYDTVMTEPMKDPHLRVKELSSIYLTMMITNENKNTNKKTRLATMVTIFNFY